MTPEDAKRLEEIEDTIRWPQAVGTCQNLAWLIAKVRELDDENGKLREAVGRVIVNIPDSELASWGCLLEVDACRHLFAPTPEEGK